MPSIIDDLIGVGIIGGLALWVYCKRTGKTIKEVIQELKGLVNDGE